MVDAFIKLFLTDDLLRHVFDGVTRAKQGEEEDEADFSQRLSEVARKAMDVFSPDKLFKHYLCGLKDAVGERINAQLQTLPGNKNVEHGPSDAARGNRGTCTECPVTRG